MKERNICFDISKGIAITLMVLGHSSLPRFISDWIYSFHMPFFYFISGVLTKWDDTKTNNFIKHKYKSLMVPFFFYTLINLLMIPSIVR